MFEFLSEQRTHVIDSHEMVDLILTMSRDEEPLLFVRGISGINMRSVELGADIPEHAMRASIKINIMSLSKWG